MERNRNGLAKENKAEHTVWLGIKHRCTLKNDINYPNYGGRGIKICKRWEGVYGFQHFLIDMDKRPTGTTIDRIDNDGDYCPENCRWATCKEQANNRRQRRDARLITAFGETKTIQEWAKIKDLRVQTITSRIASGDKGESLLRPSRPKRPNGTGRLKKKR